MQRERIDVAIHAQLQRLTSLLRDVVRSGGKDHWSHLFSHGHSHSTVRSAIRQRYLIEHKAYHYEITDDGLSYLSDLDVAQVRTS